MAATNYTLLVAALRVEADDTATSNPVFQQTPAGDRNATNTLFKLPDTNIVAGSTYYTYGASIVRALTGFTLDSASGYVTVTAAPDNGTTQPFFFDYYFQWYTDADYMNMIDRATEELGSAAGTATPEGLYPALLKLALERYWSRRSSSHANKYATSAAGGSAQAQTPAQNFIALAKAARAAGLAARADYYTNQGQNKSPASGTITYGFSPYTPRR